MILRAKHEVDRKYPGFRLHGRRVRRRRDREIDVAGPQFLQYLGFLAELRSRKLVDDHRAFAEFLQLVGKGIGSDPVGRRMRLVIGKAEMARLGSLRPDRRRRGEEQHGGHENGIDAHSGASLSLSFIVTPQKRGARK